MLVGSAVRRVAIVGGVRIPFARSYTAYATASNQDMLTAAFRAVVERFKLPASDSATSSPARSSSTRGTTTWYARACCRPGWTRRLRGSICSAPAARASRPRSDRQQDRARPDRGRHRRRRRHDQRCADRLPARLPAAAAAQLPRARRRCSASRPGWTCARSTSSRYCRRWSSRAPACRWARARSSWRSPGRSRAPTRTSSPTRAT